MLLSANISEIAKYMKKEKSLIQYLDHSNQQKNPDQNLASDYFREIIKSKFEQNDDVSQL